MPVRRQRDADRVSRSEPERVHEQVRGLGNPVVHGGRGQFGPLAGGIVIERQQWTCRVGTYPVGEQRGDPVRAGGVGHSRAIGHGGGVDGVWRYRGERGIQNAVHHAVKQTSRRRRRCGRR